jgi:Flp pilus assembly pilin Flp
MRSGFSRFICSLRPLLEQEHGQDLVEYAWLIALIAFGARRNEDFGNRT